MNDNPFQRLFGLTANVYTLGRSSLVLFAILLLVNQLIFTLVRIDGQSMRPTLRDGQYLVVDRLLARWRPYSRGQIVLVRFPGDPDRVRYVKRIVGLPGERLEIIDGKVMINGLPLAEPYLSDRLSEREGDGSGAVSSRTTVPGKWLLDSDDYFLLGDNRANSTDSRIFGPVDERFIIGAASQFAWPSDML